MCGKCEVVCGEAIEGSRDAWFLGGRHRWFFTEAYCGQTRSFDDPPHHAWARGSSKGKVQPPPPHHHTSMDTPLSLSQGQGKGGKGKKAAPARERLSEGEGGVASVPPLRSLDVFAGCGGLTEGLHQSGAAIAEWAVEKEESAAQAFRLNYPQATVFTDDCNALLKLAMEVREKGSSGYLPSQPCQPCRART